MLPFGIESKGYAGALVIEQENDGQGAGRDVGKLAAHDTRRHFRSRGSADKELRSQLPIVERQARNQGLDRERSLVMLRQQDEAFRKRVEWPVGGAWQGPRV